MYILTETQLLEADSCELTVRLRRAGQIKRRLLRDRLALDYSACVFAGQIKCASKAGQKQKKTGTAHHEIHYR